MNAQLPGIGDTATWGHRAPLEDDAPEVSSDAKTDDIRDLEVMLADLDDFIGEIRESIEKGDRQHIRACVKDIAGFAQKWLDTGWMK
jgi:hypothetical protein